MSDSGEGISEKEIPYIFEEFHPVDKSRHTDENQSGLGLAIVKAIVLGHGGKVWVDSTLGQGSDFHFCIPVASYLASCLTAIKRPGKIFSLAEIAQLVEHSTEN